MSFRDFRMGRRAMEALRELAGWRPTGLGPTTPEGLKAAIIDEREEKAQARAQQAEVQAKRAEARAERLEGALRQLHEAVGGDTGLWSQDHDGELVEDVVLADALFEAKKGATAYGVLIEVFEELGERQVEFLRDIQEPGLSRLLDRLRNDGDNR